MESWAEKSFYIELMLKNEKYVKLLKTCMMLLLLPLSRLGLSLCHFFGPGTKAFGVCPYDPCVSVSVTAILEWDHQ